jgi:plastocyanin
VSVRTRIQHAAAAGSALLIASCGSAPGSVGGPSAAGAAGASAAPSASASGHLRDDDHDHDHVGCAESVSFPTPVEDRGTGTAVDGTISLAGGDFFFEPTCIVAEPGSQLTISVDNVGRILHNIAVEEQDIDEDIPAGETVIVTVTVPESGTLHFICRYHTSAGMVGAVTAERP